MQIPSVKTCFLKRSPSHFLAGPRDEANRALDQTKHLRGDLHLEPNKRINRPQQRAC